MTHLNYFTIHKKPKKAKYSDNLTASQKIGIEKCLAFFKEQTELFKKQKDEQNNINQKPNALVSCTSC